MVKKYYIPLLKYLIYIWNSQRCHLQTNKQKLCTSPNFGIFEGYESYFIPQEQKPHSFKALTLLWLESSKYWELGYCHSILHMTIENLSLSIQTQGKKINK